MQTIISESLKLFANSFTKVSLLPAHIAALICVGLLLWGCSSAKHVPSGNYLLEDVKININDSTETVESSELVNYLRQSPNHKVFGFLKLQLAT